MSKICAFVDGSIYSESVCDHVAWVAQGTGYSVELLHVLGRRETSNAPSNLSGAITLGARTALLKELSTLDEQRAKLAQKYGRAILDDAKVRIEATGVGNVDIKLRFGDIVETVAEFEVDAEMVVVGKRGEAADFAKLHLGSNLERIVRAGRKPVLVASRTFKPIERFLIAYDGGASSMKAVEYVAGSALFTGLQCHLLTVGPDTDETRKRLDDARATLERAGYTVEASIVQGQRETAISHAVESEAIDLLVMGAYGHSRVRSLIIGSTTTGMIRSCKIPIALFR